MTATAAFPFDQGESLRDLLNRCEEECVQDITPAHLASDYEREDFERMRFLMQVPEIDDRDNPEFWFGNPRWPATDTKPIKILGREVFLKDESQCPSGTHKDRAAHEIVLSVYKPRIKRAIENRGPYELPPFSLISAGSMAVALQHLCRYFHLPDVRVLMDSSRHDTDLHQLLWALGAKVYEHDLSQKELSEKEVLSLTENNAGIDVTTRSLAQIREHRYYDWCCHEILDSKPNHIFVPFGSGDLFANLLSVISDLHAGKTDRQFTGDGASLRNINVYGATTYEPHTRMTKLYAAHRPALRDIRELLEDCKAHGVVESASEIYPVKDAEAEAAKHELQRVSPSTCFELSAVAGLALFMRLADQIPADDRVLIVNTGRTYIPKVLQ